MSCFPVENMLKQQRHVLPGFLGPFLEFRAGTSYRLRNKIWRYKVLISLFFCFFFWGAGGKQALPPEPKLKPPRAKRPSFLSYSTKTVATGGNLSLSLLLTKISKELRLMGIGLPWSLGAVRLRLRIRAVHHKGKAMGVVTKDAVLIPTSP